MSDDVALYRKALAPVEREARGQPWAQQRPWLAATHVGWDNTLPVVDLHDLSAALARQAVLRVLERPSETGAVVFVHGKGRHTLGPPVLRGVVHKELARACAEAAGWSFRPLGDARVVWISDWERAPAAATGRSGCWTWLLGGALLAAMVFALARALVG